jgi:hypothetical protein
MSSFPRAFVSQLLRQGIEKIEKFLPTPNIIFDHEGKEKYLSRYYLLRGPKSTDGSRPFDKFGRPKENIVRSDGWSLVLHKFHKSDSTALIHNHGWSWALSFVLCGGYSEEKLEGDAIVTRKIKPFSFNYLRPEEFHRVDLLEKDAWTLLLRGPRRNEWHYKDRASQAKIIWNEHVKMEAATN